MRFDRVFLVLVVVRAVGEMGRAPSSGLFILAGALLAWRLGRPGYVALSAVAFTMAATSFPSASIALIGWIAAALALFDGDDLTAVLRSQAVVIYGFAAAQKAVSPAFLSGAVLERYASRVAVFPLPMAFAAIAAETGLAVAVWRRWRYALPVAAGMHAMFVIGIATSPVHALSLTGFNAMVLSLVWASAPEGEERGLGMGGGKVLQGHRHAR